MGTATAMMRVPKDTHEMLHELASEEHVSLQEVLNRAVEAYRRQRIIEHTNAAYAALALDPAAWHEFQEDIIALDGALNDGLNDGYQQHPETTAR